ncbi:MAG TPA: 2-oxoacid:ferredoxin oxidoreductase subunit beta [Polyangiaceae bacterium]|nr:2-oxoacid:ferredoxin oxidoreductase subunit beta [Polyangiaceae bacterium]
MNEMTTVTTAKDWASDQEVRWCPGCGDYAVLKAVQRTMPDLRVAREKTVFISGIGCSSRFPYYMATYGFHTIHGRAPAVAMGIKAANPDLSVWIATGDGDGLSIGGNHLLHCLRRNLDVKVLLFNNRIYGLTKGQYSPTSEFGKVTKSTPSGSADQPVDPASFAIGCGGTFIARSIDTEATHLGDMLRRAAHHKGTAFIEIYQNCNVFNDGAFDSFTDKDNKADRQLRVEHGKPLLFGANHDKGLCINPKNLSIEVVTLGQNGATVDDVIVHDETSATLAYMLARMPYPEYPVAVGVLYAVTRPTYDETLRQQQRVAREKLGAGDLNQLLNAGNTWQV